MKKEEVGDLSPSFKRYLHTLMHLHGDDVLPGEIQGKIMFDLYNSFLDYLVLNMTNSLSDEKLEEFLDKFKNEDEKELQDFLKENADYKKVLSETLEEFEGVYLKNTKK